MARLTAALALAMGYAPMWVHAQVVAPTATASAHRILVSGVPPGVPMDAVQSLVQAGYRDAMAQAGHPAALSPAQLQAAADRITQALAKAGYPQAHAYLPDQVMAFNLSDAGTTVAAAPASPDAPASEPQKAPAVPGPGVLPAVRERAPGHRLAVRGFRIDGVGDHPKSGITPATVQAIADAQLKKLGGGGGQSVSLDFTQLQQVADAITNQYRKDGFIFGTAYLPAQTVGQDAQVQIRVLEGRIGKVIVKGNRRYRAAAIAGPAERLRGQVLQKGDVDSALLYTRDLPGVTVSSTFQPGAATGETDLIMVANEAKRPYTFSVGANDYGTELTGRYRAEAGFAWNSPLGLGDLFAINLNYALDPRNNVYGLAQYSVPTVAVPGLSGVIGATRSELQLNDGSFASLEVKGPSSTQYLGADWKFVNTDSLQMLGSLHYIRERSRLDTMGIPLSDERFDVAELGFAINRTDQRLHGIDLLQLSVRKSIHDRSREPDLVAPNHASDFTVGKLQYTRLQFLTKSQRLYFKLGGQYANVALIPLEQFVIGGPDSVRAYPIADGLADRGYFASLEYHVDAPGLGDTVSPFYGRPWRELLEVETFVDFARGFAAGSNRGFLGAASYKGVGAGLIFRLPRFHRFEFHLDGAVPIGGPDPTDDKGYHVYARFGFTF